MYTLYAFDKRVQYTVKHNKIKICFYFIFIRQASMSSSSSQSKSPIEIFHNKVVAQLTLHLKKYKNPYPPSTNLFQTFGQQPQHLQQSTNFTTNQISQFLYDILQLQNSSIDFIMRDIFESDRRQTWHLQQILKTVLDVQFIITVNNSILAGSENIRNSKGKENEVSFIKIDPNHLVEMVYQNCFFLENSQNSISKHLIQQIVQDINIQNGNKGYILLVQYKTYMLKNLIEKHSVRKFFTPNHKSKPFTPINKDKLIENSESIKQVDEESQIMGRSKRNFSTISHRENQFKLDQYSKINEQQQREVINGNIELDENVSICDRVHFEIWNSIKGQIYSSEDVSQQQFIKIFKQLISKKLKSWPQKYLLNLSSKLQKLSKFTISRDQNISMIIRLLGQQGFKIHHDQINSLQYKKPSQNKYLLTQNQLTQILINTFGNFIIKPNPKLILQQLAVQLIELKGQQRKDLYDRNKLLSFRNYLIFIMQLSKILTNYL